MLRLDVARCGRALGETALHRAALNGFVRAVEILLAAPGAEVATLSENGKQPLHTAAAYGHVGVAEHLAKQGAEAQAAAPDDQQPLHLAAEIGHTGVAEHLLSRGAEVRITDERGYHPLHVAASLGHVAVVELRTKKWNPTPTIIKNNESGKDAAAQILQHTT